LNPNQPEPYNNRGTVYASQGENAMAVIDFGKAIEIKPQYAEAHFNLARMNARMSQCNLASAHLKEAIALQPAYKQVARAVGDFEVCKGQSDFKVEI
jgi:Flp pilus assembly protein TadD